MSEDKERVDHVMEARAVMKVLGEIPMQPAAGIASAIAAQTHATLALVEQQRIANQLELLRIETENEFTPTDALDAIYSRESLGEWGDGRLRTRPGIVAALELQAGGDDA